MELIDYYNEVDARKTKPEAIMIYCYLDDTSEFELGAFITGGAYGYLDPNDYYYNEIRDGVPVAIKK